MALATYQEAGEKQMRSRFERVIRRISPAWLDVNYALDRGISVAGLNICIARHPPAARGAPALEICRSLNPVSVLDVGSGGGEHAEAFADDGASVTCVDYGTSIYADRYREDTRIKRVIADFNEFVPREAFSLVWASHVLEHQRNVGQFIERLIACARPEGYVAITVPHPHRRLWGGHLTNWTPGLLAYNIVLCGVDLREAKFCYGYREFSIIFSPKRVRLPTLTFDSGDLDRLEYLHQKNFLLQCRYHRVSKKR